MSLKDPFLQSQPLKEQAPDSPPIQNKKYKKRVDRILSKLTNMQVSIE